MTGSRRTALFVALVVGLSVAGVATGDALDGDRGTDDALPIKPRSDGSLPAIPQPLTLGDVGTAAEGSAARAVLELYFWGQWGSTPNVVASYAPAVIRAVGARTVADVYAAMRADLLQGRPRVANTTRTRSRTTVIIEVLRRQTQPERESFTLRRVDGRWRILSDTLLDEGLVSQGLTPLAQR